MFIESVSSINLRKKIGDECRSVDDDIPITCSGCGKTKLLGKETAVIVKIRYGTKDVTKEVHLCDICSDLFMDLLRFGKHVIYSDWKRKSFTRRLTGSKNESYCFKCFNASTSQLFFKYINENGKEISDRVCANCACVYLELLDSVELDDNFEYKFVEDADKITFAGGRI